MSVLTSDRKKLFLSADPNWNGQGFVITYPSKYTIQAWDFVKYVLAYLAHSHGDKAYSWFTQDAITEAQAMGWDAEKNKPILPDGLDLHNTLQSLDLEWCLSASLTIPAAAGAVDLDSITIPSFNTIPNNTVVQPGVASTAPPVTIQTATTTPPDASDDPTMASTVNTRLSALEQSCALLPLIMKRLEALAPPPSSSPGQGSTSTPAVTATPSVCSSTSGGRD